MKKIIVSLMLILSACFSVIGCETDDTINANSKEQKISDIEQLKAKIIIYNDKMYKAIESADNSNFVIDTEFFRGKINSYEEILNMIENMQLQK